MTQVVRTVVDLIDDLDGDMADETVEFSYRGTDYVIDLNSENAKRFDADMQMWLLSSRERVTAKPVKARPSPEILPGVTTAVVRAWAMENGHTVGRTGLISKEIREVYEWAHQRKSSPR